MKLFYSIYPVILLALLMTGCLEDPEMEGGLRNAKKPEVKTHEELKSNASSVTLTGEVLRENGAPVTEAGFCWSTESTFHLTDTNKKAAAKRKGSFESTVDGLIHDTKYYICAYAINQVDTAYGDILSFTTTTGLGSVKTLRPARIMSTTAECGGMITLHGEADIQQRGIYLMTAPTPSEKDSLIMIDMPTDSFYVTVKNLNPLTSYYVRAFAKSRYGDYNGSKVEAFQTTDGLPVLDSFKQTHVDYDFAEFTLRVASEGDSPVIASGFCYGQEPNPTIEKNDTIICGQGAGVFTGRITNMHQQIQYYVRAYVINAQGIRYSAGEGISTILESELPTVNTAPVSNIKNGSAWVGGEVLAEGASAVTEAGVCWSTSPNPTLKQNEGHLSLTSGKNVFAGTLNNLKGGVTYYVNAYATNGKGTQYGKEVTFETPPIFTVADKFQGPYRIPGSAAFCTIDNNIGCFLGGDTGPSYTNALWAYIVGAKNEWRELSPMPKKLTWQTCFSRGFGMWAFGGLNEVNKVTDDFFFYSIIDNKWKQVEEDSNTRPDGMYRTTSCASGNLAYLIGGRRDTIMNEVWTFDVSEYTWTRKPAFPIKQYGGIALVARSKIYAGLGMINLGGTSPVYTKQLWSSDDDAASWKEETSAPNINVICGVVYDNNIYVVDNNGYIWIYDTAAKSWTKKAQLAANYRNVHFMYVLNNNIYIGLGNASDTLLNYDPSWDN